MLLATGFAKGMPVAHNPWLFSFFDDPVMFDKPLLSTKIVLNPYDIVFV